MKIALINENSQAAKNSVILAALKKVVEPMGHTVDNYGMYAADDKAQLTYVQCGILGAILLNSGAADFVITGCGTGEGAMLAMNSFPGVVCGHVEDPVDAYTFAHVNDGNAVAMPFAKGFGWGGELNLEYVEILAAGQQATVYVNGKEAVYHEGGYSAFRADITNLCREDGENLLVIACDNSEKSSVYPQSADFTFYGGLYRGVNLISVPNTHFDLNYYGGPGLKVTPKPCACGGAKFELESWVSNSDENFTVMYSIQDTEGNEVASAVRPADNTDVTVVVPNAHLWSIDEPYLYTVTATLQRRNEAYDEVTAQAGVREFSCDPQKGFILNRVETLLRGVSRHQDKLYQGSALTRSDHFEDARIIKELGANTIRLAHYQHSQDFYDACDQMGFAVNDVLWNFYAEGPGSEYVRVEGGLFSSEKTATVEVPWSVYTDEVKNSFAQYGDAAVIVLSRVGGEDDDLEYASYNYLELDPVEREMLEQVKKLKDEGVFQTVVMLVNTSNALQMDFLTDNPYGIDAMLWTGGVGQSGLNAVCDILAGKVNPSGSLVATYCYDNYSSPAMVDFAPMEWGGFADSGLGSTAQYYMIYQEGIYVGYKYYETRYEDAVMGTGNTSGYEYGADVAFPFGYGLSYSTFALSDFNASYNAGEDTFQVSVKVSNTGDAAGKKTVQIYGQSPYTEYDKQNGIEKAAVQLVGFAKTGELAPGASETLTVTVPRRELASYDTNGKGTYILEDGTYYLTAAHNAHDAVNHILAAKRGCWQMDG